MRQIIIISSGRRHVGPLFFFYFSLLLLFFFFLFFFTNEEQSKRLVREVFDAFAFATHSGLVYDVTGTDSGHKMAALTVVFSRLSNVDF